MKALSKRKMKIIHVKPVVSLPACVALLALAQQCLRKSRGWGSEVKHGRDSTQQVAGFLLQGAKRLQLLRHVLDGRHLRRQKRGIKSEVLALCFKSILTTHSALQSSTCKAKKVMLGWTFISHENCFIHHDRAICVDKN